MADETKTQIPKPTRQRGPMGRMGRGEKAKDFKGTMKQLLGYIGQHKIAVFAAVAFAVCSVIFNIVGPKVLGQVTTKLFEGLVAKVNGTGDVDFAWIAKTLGFSYNHFAKIVQRLVHAGILETERGPRGGIRLAKDPRQITLLEIYEAGGGESRHSHQCLLNPRVCPGHACALGRLIDKENLLLHRQMSKTSLASLAGSFDRSKLETP